MTLSKNLHWFIYILFALSCARQTSPTGGPKDTIPPVLVKAIPPHEAINFKGNTIELEFSEDITLNAPKEQLIITPTIGKDYKLTFRRNVAKLQFEDPLQDSTTYTFNFRESIQDITERNPVRNLTLAYSTGDYIDSLSIEGTVYDLLKGKELKDATVALHIENDTFNIFEHPAIYFTKTDTKGKYKISNLKPANYFLYAFEDKNRNLIVNSRSESYGFKSEHQNLVVNIDSANIGLVRLDAGPLKITSARPYNTYFNIRTTKNLRTFTVTSPDSLDLSYTFGENQANIRIYDTTEKDSIQLHLIALDSIDNLIDTTLYAKFLTREVTPEQFQLKVNSSSLFASTGQLDAVLQFTKPVQNITIDSIYYQLDSLTRVNFLREDFTWDPLLRTMTISKQLDRQLLGEPTANAQSRRGLRFQQQPANTTPDTLQKAKPAPLYELTINKAAFISVEGDSSAHITQSIKPKTEAELSIINMEIRTSAPHYLLQLLDNNFKVVRQVANQPRVRFTNVIPGEYQVRLVIDKNENGRWDAGNYFKQTEPEPIIYYRAADGSTKLKGVKENWEIGHDGEMFITY